ncbi:hypothetical protein CR513_12670, partial [Mucuna pruriens]
MGEEANSRDARRRRRILQQGSDRLAFITGRIQTLPPPLPVSASPSQSQPNDPNTTVEDSDSISQNREPYALEASNTVIQTPPKHEGETEISSAEPEPEPEPEILSAEPEPVQVQAAPAPAQGEETKHFIIPSDITRAIDASKGTRLCCSILVALLVVASYTGFINFFKTVISFRPLYLVLVTNLTVVIARLFSGEQRGFGRRQSRGSSSGDEYALLARMLELCLVAQSMADAVFMDCAVYAVVLVC